MKNVQPRPRYSYGLRPAWSAPVRPDCLRELGRTNAVTGGEGRGHVRHGRGVPCRNDSGGPSAHRAVMIDAIIERLSDWRDQRRNKRWIAHHKIARAKADASTLTDSDLVYAAYCRCPCGAGMAYPKGIGPRGFWDCSATMTGRSAPNLTHTARLPFVFWDVDSEYQPSAHGATTRPKP